MKVNKAMVLGMARSGIAAAKLLLLRGAEVWVCDSKTKEDFKGALDELKHNSRYLFDGDVPPPYARGTGAYHGSQEKHPTTLAGALREKFERK